MPATIDAPPTDGNDTKTTFDPHACPREVVKSLGNDPGFEVDPIKLLGGRAWHLLAEEHKETTTLTCKRWWNKRRCQFEATVALDATRGLRVVETKGNCIKSVGA